MNNEMKVIGNIKINDSTVIISDPCYELGTWCTGIVENVKLGDYEVLFYFGDNDGGKNYPEFRTFAIVHKDYSKKFSKLKWTTISDTLVMDAGMSSISDMSTYKQWRKADECEEWWQEVCKTMTASEISVFQGGVICNSGYGDGYYSGRASYNSDGEAIAILVKF